MSDYKIINKTEDASKERVFYTIEIAPFRFVDVMCIRNTSENYEYLMQNGDGSYVYCKGKDTYPGYPLNERKCLNLAAAQYAKDYYAKESIWDEIRSDYYDDEQEAWAIDAWKNCDGDQGKVIAHVGDDKRISYYSEEAKTDPYVQEVIREVLFRIDEENAQKEKWVLALTLTKAMTKNVPEEHKEYVKGFLFELFKKQPNNILNHFAYEYQISVDGFDRDELIQRIMQKLHKDSDGFVSEILELTFSTMIPEGLDDHVKATLRQLPDKELKRMAKKYQL